MSYLYSSRWTLAFTLIALVAAYYYQNFKMVSALVSAKASNAVFVKSLTYRPTAVFVGGTSGIGRAMAEALANYTNGEARIILIGRNEAAADEILSSFPKPKDGHDSGSRFITCDVSLMKNIKACTTQLLSELDELHYLVMSTGYLTWRGTHDDNSEGIDKKMALNYYTRFLFAYELLPLLEKTREKGQHVSVMSILSADQGGDVSKWDDFGLKKPGAYSLSKSGAATPTYNNIMFEVIAIFTI